MCSHAARLSFAYPRCAAGHAPAFVRTTATRLGARLAMFHLELCAFIPASLTQVGTGLANRTGKLAATRHIACSQAANLGAVHIQGNAARHRFQIRFLQTSGCAMVASICACIAGFDTGCKLFMGHDYSNQELMRNLHTAAVGHAAAGLVMQCRL